jgi:quercetin dioxygenase-like cupin family protein
MSSPVLTPPVPLVLSEQAAYAVGTVASQKLLASAAGSATVFAFAPGEGFREHSTPHEALLVVVDGEAVVTFGGAVYRVRAGEAFHFPAGAPHAVHAEVEMRMLLVVLRTDVVPRSEPAAP